MKFTRRAISAVLAALATLAVVTACSSPTAAQPDAAGPASVQISGDLPALEELYSGLEGAPPADGPAAVEGMSVYLVSCGEAFPPCAVVGEEMQKAADVLGWDLKVLDGAGNVGGGYGNAIRQAIASGADGILVNGFDCSVVKQPLQEAKEAAIPVLGLEALDCDETGDGEALFTAPMQYLEGTPGTVPYWEAFGTMAAAYVANAQPEAKIIAVSTWDDGNGIAVYEAFEAGIAAWCDGCEIVQKVSGTVTDAFPGGALEQRFKTALVQHPDVSVVYALWDSMLAGPAIYGAKEVTDAGLRDQVLLVGGLGTEESISLLRSGDIDAVPHTVDKAWLSWGALDQLNRAFADEPVAGGVGGPRLLDATQDLPSAGAYATSVDYVSAYESIWRG